MRKPLDLTGRRFGHLLVQSFAGTRKVGSQSKRFWNCLCICGGTTEVSAGHLTQGNTTSCGCRAGQWKHGEANTPVYRVWHSMLQRCRNQADPSFKNYGGRGISVCERWTSFISFCADMGPRPEGATLERDDVNGNYEPGNCRWATPIEQANNRRNNRPLTLNGETKTLAQWARYAGLTKQALRHRLESGWPLEEALRKGNSRGQRRDLCSVK
jgi:hypothetical protein